MKRNYKVNRKELSDNEIMKHSDFSNLKSQFQASSGMQIAIQKFLSKWYGIAGTIITVTGIAGIAIWLYTNAINNKTTLLPNDEATNTLLAQNIQKDSKINPPFESHDIKFERFKIDPIKTNQITTRRGSTIDIPQNCFIGKDGQPENDSVTVLFREMHNPYDFFVSGIPMQYDSAGQDFTFSSAGMFEFRANNKLGQDLSFDENKQVKVTLKSNQSGDYNFYDFDETTGKWHYLGENKPEYTAVANDKVFEQDAVSEIEKTEKTLEPIKPSLKSNNAHVFKVDFDKNKHLELAQYHNVLFEIDEANNKFDESLYYVKWKTLELAKTDDGKGYTLLLSKADTSILLSVKPVFDNNNYKQAMQKYNAELVARDNRLKAYKQQQQEKMKADFVTDATNKMIDNLQIRQDILLNRPTAIQSNGIFNCDVPIIYPSGKPVIPLLCDNNGNKIEFNKLYTADYKKNALFENTDYVYVSKCEKDMAWTITSKGDIAIITFEDLQKIAINKKTPINVNVYEYHKGLEIIENAMGS